jgi:hypothetical protein
MLESILSIKVDEMVSKVRGRRNYVIYLCDNSATLYGWGQAKRRGILGATLSYIKKHKVHWLEYTYKKDALEMLNALAQQGYRTRMGE